MKTLPRHLLALLLAGAGLWAAAPAGAFETRIELLDPERGSLLRHPSFDLLAVTVLAADPRVGTNGAPPKVTLWVDEAIRGEPPGNTVVAVWEPPYFGQQDDPDGSLAEAWRDAPLEAPLPGERLIVFGIDRTGVFTAEATPVYAVQAHQVYAWSEANLETARAQAVHRRDEALQLGLFIAVPSVVVLSLVPFVLSWLGGLSAGARRRHNLAVVLAGALAAALYAAYETGVPPYSAIRVDLLILAPTLALALVLSLVSLVRLLWRRKRA